jgi:putative transposase
VNSRFAKIMNKKLTRQGQFVMDRFKSPIIYTNQDLISVMRYVDLNPYRAKMVKHPENYKWSSYNYYSRGTEDVLITESPAYNELGNTIEEKQKNYTKIIDALINTDNGSKKEKFSTTFFIGEATWVKQKYIELKNEIKRKKEIKLFQQQISP